MDWGIKHSTTAFVLYEKMKIVIHKITIRNFSRKETISQSYSWTTWMPTVQPGTKCIIKPPKRLGKHSSCSPTRLLLCPEHCHQKCFFKSTQIVHLSIHNFLFIQEFWLPTVTIFNIGSLPRFFYSWVTERTTKQPALDDSDCLNSSTNWKLLPDLANMRKWKI